VKMRKEGKKIYRQRPIAHKRGWEKVGGGESKEVRRPFSGTGDKGTISKELEKKKP